MTVTQVASKTGSTGSSASSVTVTYNSTPVVGNLLLISLGTAKATGALPTVTTPSGWTALTPTGNTSLSANSANSGGVWLLGRVATGTAGDNAPTITTSASTVTQWVTEEWSGLDTSAMPHVTGTAQTNTGTTSVTGPITTTVANEWVYTVAGGRGNMTTSTWSGGSTADVVHFSSAPATLSTATQTVSVAGSVTPTDTFTNGQAQPVNVGFSVSWAQSGGATNFNGTAAVAPTVTIATSGIVGTSTGAAVAPTVTIATSGAVGASTGAAVSPTVTVSTAGVVGVVTGATRAVTVTITADGVVAGSGISSGAAVAPTVTIVTSGAVGTLTGTTVSPTVAIATSGAVGTSTGATRATTITIATSGAVGTSTGAAVSPTVGIASAGAVGTVSGATRATTVIVTSAGVVGARTASTVGVSVSIVAAGVVGTATSAAVSVSIGITATGHVHTDAVAVDVVVAIDVDAEQWAIDGNRGARWAVLPISVPPWLVQTRPDPWVIR